MSLPLYQVTTGFYTATARPSHNEDVSLAAPLDTAREALFPSLSANRASSLVPQFFESTSCILPSSLQLLQPGQRHCTGSSSSGSSSGRMASRTLLGGKGRSTSPQMQVEQQQHHPHNHRKLSKMNRRGASEDGRSGAATLPPLHAYRRLPSFPAWGFFASIPEVAMDSGTSAQAMSTSDTEPYLPTPTLDAPGPSRYLMDLPNTSTACEQHISDTCSGFAPSPLQHQHQHQHQPGSHTFVRASAPEDRLLEPPSFFHMEEWAVDWRDKSFDRLSDPLAAGLGVPAGEGADEEAVLALIASWDSQEASVAI
jgi:hypothetical protein